MQARLFSYLDTQLTRLGGPNFTQLPINRPHCPVNDMLRDGMHQTAIHTGLAPYRPNSIDGGEPRVAPTSATAATSRSPRPVEGAPVRANPASFDDHFSQATMFYRSLTPLEQAHIVEAFTFELGKVLRAGDQGARARGAGQRRRRPVRAGRGRPRAARAEGHAGRRTSLLSPALSQIVDRARADRRPQGRRHRRRRLRPRRHRQAAQGRGRSSASTVLVDRAVGGVLKQGPAAA